MNEKDLKAIIILSALLVVGLSTPAIKEYLDNFLSIIFASIVIGLIILIVFGIIWFFFLRQD